MVKDSKNKVTKKVINNIKNKEKTDNKNKVNDQSDNLSIDQAIEDIKNNSYVNEEDEDEDNSSLNNEDNNNEDNTLIEEISEEDELKNNKKSKRVKKLENTIEGFGLNTGVLYISHLPWGINENNLKKYFEQFGKISRYILPRSKSSGRIKGYAFIEFENMEIAEIASSTMNNFILFNKIIKCQLVTDRSRYNSIFKRWKRQFKFFDRYKAFVVKRNKTKTHGELKDQLKLMIEKEDKKRLKLKSLGIDYDFLGYKGLLLKK